MVVMNALLPKPIALPQFHPFEQGYFRSKLFVTPTLSNPILAAASPLFSLIDRFNTTESMPPIELIKEHIDHEWRSYRSRLSHLNILNEHQIIATYLISATLDETIGKTYLRLHGKPVEFMAYTPLVNETIGPETYFFEWAFRMKDDPLQYLDLIELVYHCLICGFQGHYHQRPDGPQALDNLIHELYEIMMQHRAHPSFRLFKSTPPTAPQEAIYPPSFWWKITLSSFVLLYAAYTVSHYKIQHHLSHVIQHTTTLAYEQPYE